MPYLWLESRKTWFWHEEDFRFLVLEDEVLAIFKDGQRIWLPKPDVDWDELNQECYSDHDNWGQKVEGKVYRPKFTKMLEDLEFLGKIKKIEIRYQRKWEWEENLGLEHSYLVRVKRKVKKEKSLK